uniref:Large ribosomal subunit protein eL14 n=1 Tax=Caenorhabditis tropicalis TaxID=1561998 RepID=A0A1I7U6C8_9PELO
MVFNRSNWARRLHRLRKRPGQARHYCQRYRWKQSEYIRQKAVFLFVYHLSKTLFQVQADGPSSGVARTVRNLKDLHLTKFVLKVRVGQRSKGVQKAFDDAKVNENFQKTLWAKKIAQRAIRAKLTDFERYKFMKAKQMRNRIVRVELAKLKKAQK